MTEPIRCYWARGGGAMQTYHDMEWGVETHDDAVLYEFLLLEAFQAGLSWAIILKKRESFRQAFSGFDPVKVAAYTDEDVERLMNDAGIVRCRRKIIGAIENARVFLALQKEYGSFSRYLWQWVDGKQVVCHTDEHPTTTALSDAMAKDMKKRGMHYMGSTTLYSYLQAIGVVSDHDLCCFRHPDNQK